MMEKSLIEIEYINYTDLIGHNYIITNNFYKNITTAFSKLKIPYYGKFMSQEYLIKLTSGDDFIKSCNVYICSNCMSILSFNSRHSIGFIKNDKFVVRQLLESINSEIFYLSCIEMQIKNLLE